MVEVEMNEGDLGSKTDWFGGCTGYEMKKR